MNKKLKKEIDNLNKAVVGLITVYGPTTIKKLNGNIHLYFPELSNISDKYLKDLLDGLSQAHVVSKLKTKYSTIPFEYIEKIKEAKDRTINLPVGKKEFEPQQILTYGSFENMVNDEIFKPLKIYLEKEIKDQNLAHSIEEDLVFFPHLFVDSSQAYQIVSSKTKNLNKTEFEKLYSIFFESIPRYFFDGYSFKEYNQRVKELYPELYFDKENDLIKEYPSKKDYPKFSYSDLIKLSKEIADKKLYKLIDSDRIIELTINNQKVYTQILGYYDKDVGIIIYPNKEELLYTYHFLLADKDDYPDAIYRLSNIEVCLNDPGGLATENILDELKDKGYPEYPSFIRLEANHANRLVNDEEIQIIGGVLSDLLTYIKTNSFAYISAHLGEKKDDDFDIDQVYITDKETIYGGYYENILEYPFLNFDSDAIDEKKVKQLKRFEKKDISIGCYINPTVIENNELPYMLIIKDDESGMIIDGSIKRLCEMSNIKNEILDKLCQLKIYPENIHFNNDYTFEVFGGYENYFNCDFVENDELNDIYNEIMNFELEEDVKEGQRFS